LLRAHAGDLGDFLTKDPRGLKLPGFIDSLAERLVAEQAALQGELNGLFKNIGHIKEIVDVQQNYAKTSKVIETVVVADVVDEALRMHSSAFERHRVEVVQNYEHVAPVRVDRHKVLHILINLLSNAKHALIEHPPPYKRIAVGIGIKGDTVEISVADNGSGIAAENLSRIFAHGFTTRKEGHGFGLHIAALAAQEIGGSLAVTSAGAGCGAIFTLGLPVDGTLSA